MNEPDLCSKATGDYVESFTSKHLLEDDVMCTDPEKLEYIKLASAALYIGGGDSVCFFFALLPHPMELGNP
jgi:hypothetical protein